MRRNVVAFLIALAVSYMALVAFVAYQRVVRRYDRQAAERIKTRPGECVAIYKDSRYYGLKCGDKLLLEGL